MAGILGYMLTWTTYGAWLQGDRRGYVKDGEVLGGNERLEKSNRDLQAGAVVRLSDAEQEIVSQAIQQEATKREQCILAMAVNPVHVHVVGRCSEAPIGRVVAWYKSAGRLALKRLGRVGRVWTRGYDKRFCFDHDALETRIRYVESHNGGSKHGMDNSQVNPA